MTQLFWIRTQQVGQICGVLLGLAFIFLVGDTLGIVLGLLLIIVNVFTLVMTTRRATAVRRREP